MAVRILTGDCRGVLPTLAPGSVQCCVTSPPYLGLRDYGHDAQIGLEDSPDAYVAALVDVFRGVRDVLADDGTLWLNLGDTYSSGGRTSQCAPGGDVGQRGMRNGTAQRATDDAKPKDLLGIPWRVALALQADGWWLRQDIVWHKSNPMPESVTDRCTKAHEYVFLLSKAARYHFDAEAIAETSAEPRAPGNIRPVRRLPSERPGVNANLRGSLHCIGVREARNRRSVWTIPTQPFDGAHFATMPPDLARLCILAGSRPGDTVLDPFGGAGTTGLVADRLQRDALLIELSPTYAELARARLQGDAPLFAEVDLEAGASAAAA